MKISKLLAFISFGLVLAQPAFSLEQPLTYPEVLDSALNNSPLVRQIEAQAQHSIASGLELSTMQNPEISAEVRPYVSGGEDKDQE